MQIRFYRPCSQLREHVRYYYVLRCSRGACALTFPLGCPQIIFHKRAPLAIPELGCRQHQFTASGQVNFPSHVYAEGDVEMIVAVFHAHASGTFLGVSPSEFRNLEISGHDIGNMELDGLASRIFDCQDEEQCIRLLENGLLSLLRRGEGQYDGRMRAVLRHIMADPSLRTEELAGISCLGARQFRRVFNDAVGMNPKEYARIVRFQKSLWVMQNGLSGNYADIAFSCGYSDQSHFIREFKEFSGHTPESLLAECRPYSDLFTNPV